MDRHVYRLPGWASCPWACSWPGRSSSCPTPRFRGSCCLGRGCSNRPAGGERVRNINGPSKTHSLHNRRNLMGRKGRPLKMCFKKGRQSRFISFHAGRLIQRIQNVNNSSFHVSLLGFINGAQTNNELKLCFIINWAMHWVCLTLTICRGRAWLPAGACSYYNWVHHWKGTMQRWDRSNISIGYRYWCHSPIVYRTDVTDPCTDPDSIPELALDHEPAIT